MDVAEFVARFIEREDAAIKQVVFGFLGYAILAIAGLVYVMKEYCGKYRSIRRDVPDTTRLLVCSFAFAAIACFLLTVKSDGRKNFCITWLPALRAANADRTATGELITKFCEDYHRFDMCKGLPKGMEEVFETPLITRLGYYAQNEYLNWLNIFLVLFSIDCYRTAIRRICLKDRSAPCLLQTIYRWLYETQRGGR